MYNKINIFTGISYRLVYLQHTLAPAACTLLSLPLTSIKSSSIIKRRDPANSVSD